MTSVAYDESAFLTDVRSIAKDVARPAADAVDRDARFPYEALDALRTSRMLSAFVPPALGGLGISFAGIASACFELSRACSASGMIFAMHQIQVGSIVRHHRGLSWFETYLTELCERQLLLASATTEDGVGGDLRSSVAALEPDGAGLHFEKRAPTVSYGLEADDLLVTVRRDPSADRGDQVLVLVRRSSTTTSLEQTSAWDTLGMRGTCSPGFVIRARIEPADVLPVPFADIAAETMVPFSHLLWSHVWLGIAAGAYDRARAFVQSQARKAPGVVPSSALHLSELATAYTAMQAEIADLTSSFSPQLEADAAGDELSTVGSVIRLNALKISASTRAPEICNAALGICGIAGYSNVSPFSIGRHLRDALSASLMISNGRIHSTNAALLLVHRVP